MQPRRRRRIEDGATAVEYAIMVALIAVVIMASVLVIGQKLNENAYKCVDDALKAAPLTPTCVP